MEKDLESLKNKMNLNFNYNSAKIYRVNNKKYDKYLSKKAIKNIINS